MLNHQSILITGGTGSFGKRFIKTVLERYPDIQRLLIFSRDEFKQYQISKKFPQTQFPQLEYVLGDVRDYSRLEEALEGIDIVIHAAALKQVDTSEKNPMEFIKTNVLGVENIIKASKKQRVRQVIAISSDKAVLPISLYGASKLCADKLFLAENSPQTRFSVVRYGNVVGARGSVIPLFLEQAEKQGFLTLTNPEMTRFLMPLGSEVTIVLEAIKMGKGQEIFVAKCPSIRLADLVKAISPDVSHKIIGMRPGEKLHEEMIASNDAPFTIECDKYFVTLPNLKTTELAQILHDYKANKVADNFMYYSGENRFLTLSELRAIVKTAIDT